MPYKKPKNIGNNHKTTGKVSKKRDLISLKLIFSIQEPLKVTKKIISIKALLLIIIKIVENLLT
jgi:hypothetical protein